LYIRVAKWIRARNNLDAHQSGADLDRRTSQNTEPPGA
jgi:hypothetical protein